MSKNSLRFTKKQYITVICLYYGCSVQQAEKYYQDSSNEVLEELYNGYLKESKRSFYTD